MVDFQRVSSFDEVVERVKEDTSGTLFEYEHLAFQNFQSYIEFRLECDERFFDSWYARVGEMSDFRDMVGLFVDEWDESEFRDAVASAEGVSYLDALKFTRDVMKYRRNEIVEEGFETVDAESDEIFVNVSDADVLSSIASMYNFPGQSDAEAVETIQEELEELQEDLDSFRSAIRAEVMRGDGEVVIDDDPFSDMSIAEFVGAILSEEVEIIESEIAEYGFESRIGDIEVGDEFVHVTPYVESAMDMLEGDDSTARAFQTIIEVTDVFMVEKDGVEMRNFEYEIIKKDDRLLEAYPGHYIGGEQMPLGPEQQEKLYRPIGEGSKIATDVLLDDIEYNSS